MARRKEHTFGRVIRERRRRRELTQQEVARRIRTSTAYIAHLESGRRRPSEEVVRRLAEVLGLEQREIYLLANPWAVALLEPRRCQAGSLRGSSSAKTNVSNASTM